MRITEKSTVAELRQAIGTNDIDLHVRLDNWLLKQEIEFQRGRDGNN